MKSVGLGLAFLLVLGFGFTLGWTSEFVVRGATPQTVLQSITILATVFIAVWTYRATKRKEAEARLFTQKAAVFEPLVEQLKRLHLGGKDGHPLVDNQELGKALIDIQFKAIIWGGQPFIRELIRMGEATPEDSTETLLAKGADLYGQIRRELGHNDPPGTGYDIMELLLVAADRPLIQKIKRERFQQRRKT